MSTTPRKQRLKQDHSHWHLDRLKKTESLCACELFVNLFVVVCVECQAEQIGGIFGGAIRLGSSLVLYVFNVKSWSVSITGGGPDELGGLTWVAQNRFQLPDLNHTTLQDWVSNFNMFSYDDTHCKLVSMVVCLETRCKEADGWREFRKLNLILGTRSICVRIPRARWNHVYTHSFHFLKAHLYLKITKGIIEIEP